MMYQTLKPHCYELSIVYIYLFNFHVNMNNFIANLRNNCIGHGFIYNFKDPISLYNFKSEYYIAMQFYIKTSKVISNVFDYISKVIVIVIITFLQVL